jgi:hypothetical protein
VKVPVLAANAPGRRRSRVHVIEIVRARGFVVDRAVMPIGLDGVFSGEKGGAQILTARRPALVTA